MNSISDIEKEISEKEKKIVELTKLKALMQNPLLTDEQFDIVKESSGKLEKVVNKFQSKILKKITKNDFENYSNLCIKVCDLTGLSVSYLLKNFIVESEITMIAGKPGGGKSITAVAMCNYALKNNLVDYIFYFDFDNSANTLKDRSLDILLKKYEGRFLYFSPIKKKNGKIVSEEDIWSVIFDLEHKVLKRTKLLFDSAKNFLFTGADRDKNKDVSPLMKRFKIFRNNGATVVFLHHTNKPQKDIDDLTYAGSSAWLEDTSNAFILSNNEDKKSFTFTPVKKRVGNLSKQAFIYDAKEQLLNSIDIDYANETNVEIEIRNSIFECINANDKPTYSMILKYCMGCGYPKDTINIIIQNGKGKYWKATKERENHNRDIFILLDMADKSDS